MGSSGARIIPEAFPPWGKGAGFCTSPLNQSVINYGHWVEGEYGGISPRHLCVRGFNHTRAVHWRRLVGAPAGRNGLWNWDLGGTSQPLPSVENTFYSGIGHLHAQESTSFLQASKFCGRVRMHCNYGLLISCPDSVFNKRPRTDRMKIK